MSTKAFEILAYEPTLLGTLCLRRRRLASDDEVEVTEVTLDGEFLMSSLLTDSEQALAEVGIARHACYGQQSLEVLVGGLGLGYTAAAALRQEGVASVEVIEYLPQVIDWLREGLIPLSEQLKSEPRLAVTEADIYAKLTSPPIVNDEQPVQYDVILIDVDHSPEDLLSDANRGFYTPNGLELASEHLRPGGVLGIWSYAESTPLVDALQEVFGVVQQHPVTAYNRLIHQEQTDWLFFVEKGVEKR